MRRAITAAATLAVVAVLVATGIGLVLSQRRLLISDLDESIRTRVAELAGLVAQGKVPETLSGLGEDDAAAQVVAGGTVVAASANLAGRPPIAGAPPVSERARTVTGLPHDEAAFRLLSRRVAGPDGPVVIHVAGTLDDIHDSTRALAVSLTVAIPLVAALLGGLIWWLVGRTLRPVEAIRAEVAAIGGDALDRRVPVPSGHDEITRLAATMNDMLERVEDAATRQARFVADASHELRSPLTRMRAELEVDLAHTTGADLAATHRSLLEETVGLQHLVEDLLQLARSDGTAAAALHGVPVDLDDIVLSTAGRLRAGGTDVGVVVEAVQVLGHAGQLARAVANLADNAARHATARVTLSLAATADAAVLAVADDGLGIPAADQHRIFDRFTRLDEARSANGGGAGLGLAIARDVATRHGGTLVLDPDHGPGARFVLRLPRIPATG